MKIKKIILVAGARPNFMKIAPLMRELIKIKRFSPILVHTGQHYDYEMSKSFFEDLSIKEPDYYLKIGSDTHSVQTAKVMIEFEKVCFKEKPDLVIVVGDVNSTLGASLVASKLCIPLAHIEAGLRSYDRTMPEEINRVLTDSLSDYLFTSCREAGDNLIAEGISEKKIFFVGNIMIDTLVFLKNRAEKKMVFKKFGLKEKNYALCTLHRPSNVDSRRSLKTIMMVIKVVAKKMPIIFPVHPRTRKQMQNFAIDDNFNNKNIKLINPLGYLDFLSLMLQAKVILTDSGGVQEESTYLSIPCLTLRHNTERPITVTEGTNTVVGLKRDKIIQNIKNIINGAYKKGSIPELWDGKTASRIVRVLNKRLA